jgi:alkanesulfonate monooxygenase SsuD/methylene tetrahydromethanopterin reductase-like flavin-dependent oxidoreductase (luciferase family)
MDGGGTALHIVGNPITVKAGIENLAARTQADEIIISTMIHDHRKRRRSYELIARAFALEECGKDFRKKNTSAPSLRLV